MNITKKPAATPSPELPPGIERSTKYLMDAIQCFGSEWAMISAALNGGDALDTANSTKKRIQTMIEEDADKLAAALKDVERLTSHQRMAGRMIHNMTVGNQAAWIAWRNEGSAEEGMRWIENGLLGPGLIPGDDEAEDDEKVANAQAYFDANIDGPVIWPRKDEQAARIARLEAVLVRLLASDPATGECSDEELQRAATDTSAPEFVQEQAAAMIEARACIHGTQAPLALTGDWKPLVDKAIAVLQRNAPPDGLSDHEALTELFGIFDGPEYRAIAGLAAPVNGTPA